MTSSKNGGEYLRTINGIHNFYQQSSSVPSKASENSHAGLALGSTTEASSSSFSPYSQTRAAVNHQPQMAPGPQPMDPKLEEQSEKRREATIHKKSSSRIGFFLILFLVISVVAILILFKNGFKLNSSLRLDQNFSEFSFEKLVQKAEDLLESANIELQKRITKTEQPVKLSGVQLGHHLLNSGDPSGAEAICNSASEATSDDIEAWICLGEARLALHDAAWRSDSMRGSATETGFVFSRLHHAKDDFKVATSLDPTNARARAGLGLSLFLLATRMDKIDSLGTSSRELLFDAILHLTAAATFTAPNWPIETPTVIVCSETTKQHVSSLHNAALAYLALGDEESVVPLLRRAMDAVSNCRSDEKISSSRIFVNLGISLLQRGQNDEAMKLMQTFVDDYCGESLDSKRQEKPLVGTMQSLCSAAFNGLGVASELTSASSSQTDDASSSPAVANYEASISWDKSKETHFPAAEANKRVLIEETTQIMKDSNFVPSEGEEVDDGIDENKDEIGDIDSEESSTTQTEEVIKSQLDVALDALERAVDQNPDRASLWLRLSRTRTLTGDQSGAVDAAVKAVEVAIERNEIDDATSTLEEALREIAPNSHIGSIDTTLSPALLNKNLNEQSATASEVTSLRQEQEILNLKLQLLQKTVMMNNNNNEHKGVTSAASSKTCVDVLTDSENSFADAQNSPPELGTSDKDIPPVLKTASVEEASLETSATTIEIETTDMRANEEGSNATKEDVNSSTAVMPDSDHPSVEENGSFVESENNATTETLPMETSPKETLQSPNVTETAPSKTDVFVIPPLFDPTPVPAKELSAIARSYMKMADVYMTKQNYKFASKQFTKVLKKDPNHLPAILGYATALERTGRPKQAAEVAMTYANATRVAVEQGEDGIADAALRRAMTIVLQMKGDSVNEKLPILWHLAQLSTTTVIAADVYYEIGAESLRGNENNNTEGTYNATMAFQISDIFMLNNSTDETQCHAKSRMELGKLALDVDGNAESALELSSSALNCTNIGEDVVEALVISGKARKALGDLDGAIADFRASIEQKPSSSTATAYHLLAVSLSIQNGDQKEIEAYFEQALNMGMDLTSEAIEALGEHHISVIRSANRAKWEEFQRQRESGGGGERGGIMGGGGSLSSSDGVFAPRKETAAPGPQQSETLSILEQGASSYEGKVPTGVEGGAEDRSSIVTEQKSSRASTGKSN